LPPKTPWVINRPHNNQPTGGHCETPASVPDGPVPEGTGAEGRDHQGSSRCHRSELRICGVPRDSQARRPVRGSSRRQVVHLRRQSLGGGVYPPRLLPSKGVQVRTFLFPMSSMMLYPRRDMRFEYREMTAKDWVSVVWGIQEAYNRSVKKLHEQIEAEQNNQ